MSKFTKRLWFGDEGLSSLMILLLLQVFVFYPVVSSFFGRVLVHLGFVLILISGVMTVAGTPFWGRMVRGFAVLAFVCNLVESVQPSVALDSIQALLTVIFSILLIAVILLRVFHEGPINVHRIAGAVAVYLLIGFCWGGLFLVIALLIPGSFSFSIPPLAGNIPDLQAKLVYFSFVTLTTIGYGDIHPVHPAAQNLAVLEGLVGQLFPAILIARLVSMEIEDRRIKRGGEPNDI